MRFGLQTNDAFTPFVDSSSMACVEINNENLVFKCAVSNLTTTSTPALVLTNTDNLFIKITLVSQTEINCIVKNVYGGAELYNKTLTTNIPFGYENNASLPPQLRFVYAATSSIASNGVLASVSRACHFQEIPNWLKNF
jgi:hypothetical protein